MEDRHFRRRPGRWNRLEPLGPGGNLLEISQREPHDLAETERHEGEIITAQSKHRCAQHDPQERSSHRRNDQTTQEPNLKRILIDPENITMVRPHAKECTDPQLKQPGSANYEIQYQSQNNVDENGRESPADRLAGQFESPAVQARNNRVSSGEGDHNPQPRDAANKGGHTFSRV